MVWDGVGRPRVLFVGRTRYRLPLEPELRRKFDALERPLELRVFGAATLGDPRRDGTFVLVPPKRPRVLNGVLFYASLPFRVARQIRHFRPDTIVAESAHSAFAALAGRRLARDRTPVVLEVHGDWRASTRLYGSPVRSFFTPLADRAALAALRRADAVRTLSLSTTRLVREHGVEPAAVFPAYVDLATFLDRPPRPPPDDVQALFVGTLERYKNVDGLAQAWRAAAPQLPDVRLRIVGDGPLAPVVDELVRDLPAQTRWDRRLSPPGVLEALDESSVLVLASRSEGVPRVAIEALCRGRPVLATNVGGVSEVIEDGVNGFIVDSTEPEALAAALVRVLAMPEALEPLAFEARESAAAWYQSPEQFAERFRRLVFAAAGLPGFTQPDPGRPRAASTR